MYGTSISTASAMSSMYISTHFDDIADAVEMDVPYMFNDHRARHGAMRITEKKLEKRVLLHLEVNDLPRTPYLTRCRIQFQIGDPESRSFLGAPPEQSADPGGKLSESKWLDQIIIGACIKAGDFVVHSAFGRQYEDWQIAFFGPDFSQHFQPGELW